MSSGPHENETEQKVPVTLSSCIGNDIVDISLSENLKKSANLKLTQRVLSATEQVVLLSAEHKELTFLSMWAAKESAYKLLKKVYPDLLFSPSRFEVSGAEGLQRNQKTQGHVNYASDIQLGIDWEISEHWIHCVALAQNNPPRFTKMIEPISDDLIKGEFCPEELVSIYSDQSKAVRNLAKRLLRKHNINNARIIRHKEQRRYSPPLIYVNNKLIKNFDLSLSHDGKFMAAVLASESEAQ